MLILVFKFRTYSSASIIQFLFLGNRWAESRRGAWTLAFIRALPSGVSSGNPKPQMHRQSLIHFSLERQVLFSTLFHGADKRPEQWVRTVWPGKEFGMELGSDHKRVVGYLCDFHQTTVRR
jgi:hypothetical protein